MLLLQNRKKSGNVSNNDSKKKILQENFINLNPFYLNKMTIILVLKVFVLQV